MLLQNLLRRVEVCAGRYHGVEAFILDLIHVDCRVPGREKCRRADPVADFRRQRVHLIAEHCLVIRQGAQIELPGIPTEFAAECRQQLVAVDLERRLTRPELLNDLDARIVAT